MNEINAVDCHNVATGLDAFWSSFSTSRKSSRNQSPSPVIFSMLPMKGHVLHVPVALHICNT